MLPPKILNYVLIALGATPNVLERLLDDVTDASTFDNRPFADRFTLREMLAHIADWEEIFLYRITQLRDEDNPILVGIDEGEKSIKDRYDLTDPGRSFLRFRTGRQALLETVRSLTPEQWDRSGTHTEVGPITMSEQVVLILAHDGYHLQQVVDWTN